MPSYRAPVQDVTFLLNHVFGIEKYGNLPGFSDLSAETLEAILAEGAKLCEEVLQPLNRVGDIEGCKRHEDGRVTTPKGFKAAYDAFAAGGWVGLSADPEYGGQGLPYTLGAIMNEFASSANMAFSMYPGLTMGAIAALNTHASDEIKRTYLPKMIEGPWTGTMNLTEPHCGTDLGLIKTRATRQPDGSFRITGTKIFISAGEHDLSDNIIHLVLARIEGAPEGVKGISLFVVPKFLVNPDGSLGARNPVACGAIEHKMGIHGNSTCVMNYDGATGWLVGEENRGLNAMFVMMNEARLGVAIQGLAQSEVAYQNAVAYARDRIQGRALTGAKEPTKAADPIIVHPDVRRTLLSIRAFNEAARALVLWTALKSDVAHRSEDAKARQEADDHLGLMTPVLKGVLTDRGFENAVAAQQMFGGHGYIEEWGMSQFVRDARIAMIYEGANGIQALDLVGRKLPRDGGRAVMSFFNEVQGFIKAGEGEAALKPLFGPLAQGLGHLQQATMWFMQNAMAKPDNAGAGSTDYMHLFGLVALGYMWAMQAKAAHAKLAAGANGDAAALETKLTLARVFMERLMPETGTRLARIAAGADAVMALPAEMF
ncbi:acyl-CoA dehydrogenase C-terminal domain-containing protein [Rhabdaerophilum calidifontis]|uniref:acyl-CoA dehydrogenase C-terminal domain-containing protein n=1 Tax=Rhabdaerophilum calidifontis TaxID=2604328 RepID=UPI00123A8708|nr:acyl-CoA dehydrogenase C-terminal domain-containing protein [Rhabdaerophilum calidifontis]